MWSMRGDREYRVCWNLGKQELGLARAKGGRQNHKMPGALQQAGKERRKQD